MKKLFRMVVVVAVLMAILAASGCGKDESSEPESEQESHEEIPGTEKLWGSFQVFVPEGMILTGGSLIDIEDPDSLWIQPKEFGLDCIQIIKTDKDAAGQDIKAAKDEHDTAEIRKFSAGEWSWTGISYMSGEKPVQILKGEGTGHCIEVIVTGYKFDSDMVTAVLNGIQIVQ